MASLWTGIVGLRKPRTHSESYGHEPRNLQDGLWQIGAQACHILVHSNNNNTKVYGENEAKGGGRCVGSLVDVTAANGRTSREGQQLVVLIPQISSRLTQPNRSRTSNSNVSILLKSLLILMNAVFWDWTPCGSNEKRHLGRTFHLHHQGENNLSTLKMDEICSSETSVLTRATRPHIPEGGILCVLGFCLLSRTSLKLVFGLLSYYINMYIIQKY
jgi:hypothetical protein